MTRPSLWRRIRNTLTHSRRRRHGTIDLLPDGFAFTWRKRETRVPWADVTRIDVGLRDYLTFDGLYVIMFANGEKIAIDEYDDGFPQFEAALFNRWPQIQAPWNAMLTGRAHHPQYETLWRRDG